MPIIDPATRFPAEFAEWKATGGIPNVDLLGWLAVAKGYHLTADEYRAITNSIKGNAEALMLLPSPPPN